MKAVGITHSGAARYQIGKPNGGHLVIAREPLPTSDPRSRPDLAEALGNYWSSLKHEASPTAYIATGQLGDKCLSLCSNSWAQLAAAMRFSWETAHGTHFEGLFDQALDDATPHAGLLHSARVVAQAGVDARCFLEFSDHQHADHYGSALAHLEKILEKIWGDAQQCRTIFVTSASEPSLSGVISVPLGFVAKTLVDRTKSAHEGREVVDPKLQNEAATKDLFFPALMPTHSELGRLIVWWAIRFPGIPVLLAKKDVADAFKWLWLLCECSGLFSTEFQPGQAGLGGHLIIIWLVLNFGWMGGPGSFARLGTLLKVLIANFRPSLTQWHDTTPFKTLIWMDDLVVIEPLLGVRGWMSLGLAEALITKLMGPAALNITKDLAEGRLEVGKTTWGLLYNTEDLTRALPAPQLEKAAHLLHRTDFDYGFLDLSHQLVQVLRGSQEFWISSNPDLAPLAGRTNALLGTPSGSGIVQIRGSFRAQARAFLEFWNVIELQRFMIEAKESWSIRFTHSLTPIA